MPLKLSVGLSKKVGQPAYGSLGASCHVEVELDSALVFQDLDGFQQRVRQVYVACNQGVNDELSRQTAAAENGSATGEPASASNGHAQHANGHVSNHANGSARTAGNESAAVSVKQLTYARQLAGKVRNIGVRGLEPLVGTMYGKPLAALTSLEASSLTDTLKQAVAGKLHLAATGEAA